MANSILKSLKVVERAAHGKLDPVERAKQKLISNLRQQLKSAEAMVRGETYTVPRMVTVEEDGVRTRRQINKPIKAWYWRDAEGQVRFSVRVSNKVVELERGKTDILVGDDAKLPETVQLVLKAAEAGELDQAIKSSIEQRKS